MSLVLPEALPSVGVRSQQTQKNAQKKKFWEEYEPLSKSMAAEVAAYEAGPRHKSTGHLADEEFHRLREENTAARRQYRFAMQDDLKMERTGRILHMNQFYMLLKKAGINPTYAPKGAFPGMLGLYVSPDGIKQEYVCFIQVPYMQEYEEMYFDEYDVPLGPKRRGWRTVVLRLIIAGVLTEAKAHEIFGAPPINATSRRYWWTLQEIRNNR